MEQRTGAGSLMSKSRDTLIAYLQMKVGEEDWHGVSDAANDLRVLDAQLTAITPRSALVTSARCPGTWYVAGAMSMSRCGLSVGHDGGCHP
jgi:hypothetical protein